MDFYFPWKRISTASSSSRGKRKNRWLPIILKLNSGIAAGGPLAEHIVYIRPPPNKKRLWKKISTNSKAVAKFPYEI
jgi:hypothetical protein